MSTPAPQRPPRHRVLLHPWVSQPRPTVRPDRCVYCGVRLPTVCCGPEHTAYVGEWLGARCYARLFEGPVLFPTGGVRMFHIGDTVGIYPKSDTDDVPVGQGVLAATRPQYEVRDLRWRLPTRTRSRSTRRRRSPSPASRRSWPA